MARGINKVILVGNLGKDPETRYMPSGKAVTNFSIATSESWKDKQTGEQKEQTEWHNIVMYDRLAEIAAEYLRKGSQVYVEGRLRTRKWQDKEGRDRYTTEIIANEMQMLGGRSGGGMGTESRAEPRAAAPAERGGGAAAASGRGTEEFDDDIPFKPSAGAAWPDSRPRSAEVAAESAALGLGHAVVLLAAAVVAVPLFRRLGLGAVLGYLCAGLLIGPFGLAVFHEPQAILHVAELGVVLFLFLIGLEMRPGKLWALRGEIFGLGLAQVLACGALLSGVALAFGWPPAVAVIGAMGFVLSSTAVIMKMLDERGATATPAGQRAVSILLLEDLSIVPLLALVAVLGIAQGTAVESDRPAWVTVLLALAAVGVLVAAGRWALNPLFRVAAALGGREVMTAAALLVVLGSALFLQSAGLSMAMGAFLAGVLLSESTFRHQLEADVEPFRGILLGLFFLSVGMSLDLGVVAAEWRLVAAGVLAFMAVKALVIYAVARAFRAGHHEALERAALFAQGGEFAFVLYAGALAAGVFDARAAAAMSAVVILSMALTPLVVLLLDRLRTEPAPSLDGIEEPPCLSGRVLIIGFGRFGQVVSQPLLARGVDVSIIDSDVDMIRAAGNFGFKVYYGDGSRLDVLRASGAGRADAVLVCVDRPAAADRIVELVRHEFPHAKLFARAFDRGHALRLVQAGVEYQVRETLESALLFGERVLAGLGFEEQAVAETMADVRQRDQERFELQLAGGITAGRALMRGNLPTPEPAPLTRPQHGPRALNAEAADLIEHGTAAESSPGDGSGAA